MAATKAGRLARKELKDRLRRASRTYREASGTRVSPDIECTVSGGAPLAVKVCGAPKPPCYIIELPQQRVRRVSTIRDGAPRNLTMTKRE